MPTVSAIIERQHQDRTQVLIQVRWKPDKDPVYSGAFEIPAGGIYQSENVYDALKREVFEETGLRVTAIRPYGCVDRPCAGTSQGLQEPGFPARVEQALRLALAGQINGPPKRRSRGPSGS